MNSPSLRRVSIGQRAASAASGVRSTVGGAVTSVYRRLRPGSASKVARVRKSAVRSAKAGGSTAAGHPKATGSAAGTLALLGTTLVLLRRRRGNGGGDSA